MVEATTSRMHDEVCVRTTRRPDCGNDFLGRRQVYITILASRSDGSSGNSVEFSQNFVPAFRSGNDVGPDGFELDLFRIQDGKLVVAGRRCLTVEETQQ